MPISNKVGKSIPVFHTYHHNKFELYLFLNKTKHKKVLKN